jgi:hypothetical protein
MNALLPSGGPEMVEFGDVDQPRPLPSAALVRVEVFSVNKGETFGCPGRHRCRAPARRTDRADRHPPANH